jgi:hypothetical protein
MSLNRHTTFSNNVELEFKRRERDFGVSGHSAHIASKDGLLSPSNSQDEPHWEGRGGRSVWARVSSGVVGFQRGVGDTSTERSSVGNVGGLKSISTTVNGNSDAGRINGIVLETSNVGKDTYGLSDGGNQTIAKVLFNPDSKSNMLTDDSTLKLFSDRGQPSPVLESVSVTHVGALGMIKEADVVWRVFTQEQFETLSYFLCNLQKTVVVEYGWSSHRQPPLDLTNIRRVRHLQSNQSMGLVKQTDPNFYESEKRFIQTIRRGNSRTENDFEFDDLKPYEVELERRGTDYDVFIGIIKNYDIQMEDGSYIITTKLISMGAGIPATRNGNVFTTYLNTQFNTDLEKLRLDNDPRIWQRTASTIRSTGFSRERDTPNPKVSDDELDSILDFWGIMRDQSKLIFYDKITATREIASGKRELSKILLKTVVTFQPRYKFNFNLDLGKTDDGIDFREPLERSSAYAKRTPKYSPEFITDLQYITDAELKKAIIRRGRLIRNWAGLEPDVPNSNAFTFNALLGAVVGGITGGPYGVMAGAVLGGSVGEQLASGFMADDVGDNTTFKYIREMLMRIIESRGETIGKTLLSVLSSEASGLETAVYNGPNLGGSVNGQTLYGKDVWYYFDDLNINPYDWLTPYMDDIRKVLEIFHRQAVSIESTTPVDDGTLPTISNVKPIYTSIVNHLMENSGGRAHLDNGLQFGLEFAFAFVRDVFNPISDYGSPRLNLHSSGDSTGVLSSQEREITLAKLAAVHQHLKTVDAPSSAVGNESVFSLISRDAKFEQENFSFITWGLLEEIINRRFVSKNAEFLKLDSSATKLRFHTNLVSTDSSVCILPNRNAPRYNKGKLLDGQRFNLSINGINHREFPNSYGELGDDEMWLYSLFVNVKLVKSVFERTETVRDALRELLDYISGALVDNYEFQIDQRGSTTQIVDVSYSKYNSSTPRYKFNFNQANSFIRSLDIDLNHTTATQMQAIYGAGGGNSNIQGPFDSSITPIIPRGEDKLDLFAPDLIDDDDTETVDEVTTSLDNKPSDGHFGSFWIKTDSGWNNYVYPDKETVIQHMYGSDIAGEPVNSGTTIPNLSITLTVDGISGIRYWDAFNVDYVPAIYNEQGFFFVTAINHTVISGDWTTTIHGNYRLKSVTG